MKRWIGHVDVMVVFEAMFDKFMSEGIVVFNATVEFFA